MKDSNAPKPERRSRLRTLLVFTLLVLSGCGPSKEQQALDAYNRGVAHYHKGELDEAIVDYTEAIRLKPDDAEAYYNRGVAFEDRGDKSKAEQGFAKAKELGFEPK